VHAEMPEAVGQTEEDEGGERQKCEEDETVDGDTTDAFTRQSRQLGVMLPRSMWGKIAGDAHGLMIESALFEVIEIVSVHEERLVVMGRCGSMKVSTWWMMENSEVSDR